MPPYFSIIIPMYNREHFIVRAINSCLRQDFKDFEIIVVDDGSMDGSVDMVKGITDKRIKLIRHSVNQGVGPARNTGIDAASGEWIILFDSDDELLPGALTTICRRGKKVDESISRMQFMVQMDTGEVSPDPPLEEEFWDYTRYLQWMEKSFGRRSETLPVVRRVTFDEIRFYNDRTLEFPYHLDFMKRFYAWSFPDVVRLYHHDAENQLTKQNMGRTIKSAKDQALSWELTLKRHGEALMRNAPRVYKRQLSGLATLYYLSGNRLKGIRYSFLALANGFFSLRNWGILLLGILGPKPIAWIKTIRAGIR